MSEETTYCAEEGRVLTLEHRHLDVVQQGRAPTLRESLEKLREAIDNVIDSLGGEKGAHP